MAPPNWQLQPTFPLHQLRHSSGVVEAHTPSALCRPKSQPRVHRYLRTGCEPGSKVRPECFLSPLRYLPRQLDQLPTLEVSDQPRVSGMRGIVEKHEVIGQFPYFRQVSQSVGEVVGNTANRREPATVIDANQDAA